MSDEEVERVAVMRHVAEDAMTGRRFACPKCGRRYTAVGHEVAVACDAAGRHRLTLMRAVADTPSQPSTSPTRTASTKGRET